MTSDLAGRYSLTLSDLSDIPAGTILRDWFDQGVRCLILRGPVSLTAYVGIPQGHPLSEFAYDDIGFLSPHGGLTFGAWKGDDKPFPQGYFWYGWDYAHSGDKVDFGADVNRLLRARTDEHAWTIGAVTREVQDFLYDFTKLMRLAEQIEAKAKGCIT